MMKSIIPDLHLFVAGALALQGHTSQDICSSSLLRHSHFQQSALKECEYFGNDFLSPISAVNSSYPWTAQSCRSSTESFCVFSSQDFAGGRGISILTTPDRAKNFQQLPAFVNAGALPGVNEQPSPPFEERELPGRGRGLIANKTLHRGDRIFAHTPILMFDGDSYEDLEKKEWLELEHIAVNNLPPKTKTLFSELYGRPVTDPVSDRIDTNAFQLRLEDTTYYAVFPEIAVSTCLI
jgi:hypothetical protein